MIKGGVGGGGEKALSDLRAAHARWPVPFRDAGAALAIFGADSPVARAWVDGSEDRTDSLWTRWDLDAMVRPMEPALRDKSCASWEIHGQPPLLEPGEGGIINAERVRRMVALRPDVQMETIPNAGHDVLHEQGEAPGAVVSLKRVTLVVIEQA